MKTVLAMIRPIVQTPRFTEAAREARKKIALPLLIWGATSMLLVLLPGTLAPAQAKPEYALYRMIALMLLFVFVLIMFAFLSMIELWLARKLGCDIVGRLEALYEESLGRFYLEASGVFAFLLAQPIIFTVIVWWLTRDAFAQLSGGA